MKKAALLLLTASVAAGAMGVYAEENQVATKTVTAQDGLITIELPNEKWYAITTQECIAEFSDGDCGIRLNVYKNGDTLPAVQVADSVHERVYEAIGSTPDYVYRLTGLVTSADDFEDILKAVHSAKIDTSKITDDMLNPSIAVEEYTISETNYTAWVNVNDGLNIRSGSSVDAEAVGSLSRGEQVTVTGVVLRNGIENGWVRIKANGVEGFVSAQFISTSEVAKPYVPETKANATRTGESKTLYFKDASAVTIYAYTDGSWRSDNNVLYWGLTDYEWTNEYGNAVYTNKPEVSNASRTGNTITLYHANSNQVIAYEYTDGSWKDDMGISYGGWPGNGYLTSSSGETLYTYDPISAAVQEQDVDDEPKIIILIDDNGNRVTVYSDNNADGSWTDGSKRYFRWNAFGTWICDGVYYYETDQN